MSGWITHMSWFLSIRNPAAAVGQGGGRVCGSEAPGRGKVRFRPVPRRHTAAAWLTRRPGRTSPPTPLTLRSLASMSTKTGEPRPWHCHGAGRAGGGRECWPGPGSAIDLPAEGPQQMDGCVSGPLTSWASCLPGPTSWACWRCGCREGCWKRAEACYIPAWGRPPLPQSVPCANNNIIIWLSWTLICHPNVTYSRKAKQLKKDSFPKSPFLVNSLPFLCQVIKPGHPVWHDC